MFYWKLPIFLSTFRNYVVVVDFIIVFGPIMSQPQPNVDFLHLGVEDTQHVITVQSHDPRQHCWFKKSTAWRNWWILFYFENFPFSNIAELFFFVIITICTSCLLHNQSQIICQLNTINVKGIRGISFYFPGDWWYVDHAKWYFFKGITTSCLIHILSNDLPPYEKHETMKRILFSCPFANIALIFSPQ